MRKLLLLIFLAIPLAAPAQGARSQQILKAMTDEMARTEASLKRAKLAEPYFITYTVYDNTHYSATARLGALQREESSQNTKLAVTLRVGGPKDDNAFFYEMTAAPRFDDGATAAYEGLRNALWLQSDAAYNAALAALAKKQAYKKSHNMQGDYADFSPALAASMAEPLTEPKADAAYWRAVVKELSAQGDIKELDNFTAGVNIAWQPSYFISSEGAFYQKDNVTLEITLNARARTKEGFELNETKTLTYARISDAPAAAELKQAARDFAREVAALTTSPKAGAYIGPVLLEAPAAARFLERTLQALNGAKPILLEGEEPYQGELTQKLGLKILPAGFDLEDNPQIKEFNGLKLLGYNAVDDEGVGAQNITLVQNGKLVAVPTSRGLIEGQHTSNGHARIAWPGDLFAYARLSNLFLKPRAPVPAADFRAKFMEFCRQEGLEDCLIIKGSPYGAAAVYKINAATGAEAPLHGAQVRALDQRSLRDIVYAADDAEAFNFSGQVGVTVIAPSLILREAEVTPVQRPNARKPLVPRP